MGVNLTQNTSDPSKGSVVNEKKVPYSKRNNLKIEDFSPKVMTIEDIKKERIEKYTFIL